MNRSLSPSGVELADARARYAQWGIPDRFLDEHPTLTIKEFNALLRVIEPRIPDMSCRVVPSSFDADDPMLSGYPQSLDWRWVSCERSLRTFGSRAVMMRLPLFFQLISPLQAACRGAGAYVFPNDPENMPLGGAAIRGADIDTVVTDAKDAAVFTEFLSQNTIPVPPYWLIVHPVNAHTLSVPDRLQESGVSVAQEVHLFPGLVLLSQCEALAEQKSERFHPSESYAWTSSGGHSFITSLGEDPLPLLNLELPFEMKDDGACVCGERTVVPLPIAGQK